MLTTKEWISWWYPVPSFDFCYPLLCKNNICCRKPALILYHTKHIMSVRVLTGSYWRKWAPNEAKMCTLWFFGIKLFFNLTQEKKVFLFSSSFDFLCLFVQPKTSREISIINYFLTMLVFLFISVAILLEKIQI